MEHTYVRTHVRTNWSGLNAVPISKSEKRFASFFQGEDERGRSEAESPVGIFRTGSWEGII